MSPKIDPKSRSRHTSVALRLSRQAQPDNDTVKHLADWLILSARKKRSGMRQGGDAPIDQCCKQFLRNFFNSVIVQDKVCFSVKMVKYFAEHDIMANDQKDVKLTAIRCVGCLHSIPAKMNVSYKPFQVRHRTIGNKLSRRGEYK